MLLLLIAVETIFGVSFALGLPSPTTHDDVWSVAGALSDAVAQTGAIAFAVARGVRMSWVVGMSRVGRSGLVRAILSCCLVASAIYLLLGQIGFESSEGFKEDSLSARIIDWGSALLMAPLLEELLFRGILLRALLNRTSSAAAVAVSALAFSGFHPSLIGVTHAFGLGSVLGVLLVRTGSIWPCVALHSAWNLAVRLFEASPSTQDPVASSTFSVLVGMFITTALILGLVVLLRSGPGPAEKGRSE